MTHRRRRLRVEDLAFARFDESSPRDVVAASSPPRAAQLRAHASRARERSHVSARDRARCLPTSLWTRCCRSRRPRRRVNRRKRRARGVPTHRRARRKRARSTRTRTCRPWWGNASARKTSRPQKMSARCWRRRGRGRKVAMGKRRRSLGAATANAATANERTRRRTSAARERRRRGRKRKVRQKRTTRSSGTSSRSVGG